MWVTLGYSTCGGRVDKGASEEYGGYVGPATRSEPSPGVSATSPGAGRQRRVNVGSSDVSDVGAAGRLAVQRRPLRLWESRRGPHETAGPDFVAAAPPLAGYGFIYA